MKVFISWSGDTSHKIALTLRDWIPTVIHTIEAWVSSEDIKKGDRWSLELSKQLEETSCGIICITPTNVKSPWLNFEAGALSKSLEHGKIFPFLFGLGLSEIKGPLSQFQVTIFKKDDTLKLLRSLNQVLTSESIPIERLLQSFEISWPNLKKSIDRICGLQQSQAPSLSPSIQSPSIQSPPIQSPPVQQEQPNKSSNPGVNYSELETLKKLTLYESQSDTDLSTWMSYPIKKVQYCLESLEKKHLVIKDDYQRWSITNAGTKLLMDYDLI